MKITRKMGCCLSLLMKLTYGTTWMGLPVADARPKVADHSISARTIAQATSDEGRRGGCRAAPERPGKQRWQGRHSGTVCGQGRPHTSAMDGGVRVPECLPLPPLQFGPCCCLSDRFLQKSSNAGTTSAR